MYKIIGGDQQEYGPISAEQIRQWLAENRLNAQTKARAEGESEWKTLAELPEFADAIGLAAPGTPVAEAPPSAFPAAAPGSPGGRSAALQAVKSPALALKVTAILGLVLVGLGLVSNLLTLAGVQFMPQQMGDPQVQRWANMFGGGLGIVQCLIGGAVGVVILMGAAKMASLQNYQFAFTASILAMIPCVSPCCLLGLPFGIWALVVLSKPEIKSQFSSR